MDTVKGLIHSKIFWFNLLTVLSMIAVGDDIKQFVSTDSIIKIQAGINILLRFFTSQALADKA